MDSAPKRPWYRLHWLTWVVMAVVIGAFLNRQFVREHILGVGGHGLFFVRWSVGWPFQHAEIGETSPMVPTLKAVTETEYEWFALQLLANAVVGLALTTSSAFVYELWMRRTRRLQFGLQQFLVAIAALGVMLALSRTWVVGYRDWGRDSFEMDWSLLGLADLTNPLRWPVLVGIACTIYSLGWLALAILRRAYRLVRP